jgi:hypothetical protein
VLFYFVLRDHMSWGLLALMMACLGWSYDARLIRSVALSLRSREFTDTGIFSGMSTRQILVEEHLPYVLPIVFSTTMNNINWSIGLEVTLSVLGFTDINTPTIGVLIYWANQHTALVRASGGGSSSGAAGRHDLRRALPARRLDERIHRSAQPARTDRTMTPSPRRRRPAAPSTGPRRSALRATCGRSTTSASPSQAGEIYGLGRRVEYAARPR